MGLKSGCRYIPGREAAWVGVIGIGFFGTALSLGTIPTTLQDFFLFGSQPNSLSEPIMEAFECQMCHGNYDEQKEPFRPWAASMMGQSARDPIFHAALAIANQDADFSGDLCLRCHTPAGWIEGRSLPTNGSALIPSDFDGVSCNFCHRMADPIFQPGSPIEDIEVLANAGPLPPDPHSGNYIVDHRDRRRGPFVLPSFFPYHEWLHSPFHTSSRMCATCHDVSNPVYERQPDGTYALGAFDWEHPTGSKYDMFPIERTYSEWEQSAFAKGPINMGGRFGGNLLEVSSCQDCHMPQTDGAGCRLSDPRPDLPQHHFNGGNTWVLRAIRNLYPDEQTYLSEQSVEDSIARATYMLQAASDMELYVQNEELHVRIINQSGHKLPTGYPEGRRMWINVRFLDANNNLVAERGHYDFTTAALTYNDTKVYEGKLGVDAAVSAATGVPAGPSFHFVLNNLWLKDNRIPPRGFTNAGFASVQAAPVAYAYADGQHWDDTAYAIPPGAAKAQVKVYYQTTSREYIEFLRDANTTNDAGQIAYQQWLVNGMSEPVVMDEGEVSLGCYANCDGSATPPVLNVDDFVCFMQKFAAADPYANCDGSTTPPVLNVNDFVCFMQQFAGGCP